MKRALLVTALLAFLCVSNGMDDDRTRMERERESGTVGGTTGEQEEDGEFRFRWDNQNNLFFEKHF